MTFLKKKGRELIGPSDRKSANTHRPYLPRDWLESPENRAAKTPNDPRARDLWDDFSAHVRRYITNHGEKHRVTAGPVHGFAPPRGDGPGNPPIPCIRSLMPLSEDGTKHHRGRRPKKQRPLRTLDLHGFRTDETPRALWSFLSRSQQEHPILVRIITGKSLKRLQSGDDFSTHHSAGHRLRDLVPRLLNTAPFSAIVRFYQTAPAHDGGDGALYVYLKKKTGVL